MLASTVSDIRACLHDTISGIHYDQNTREIEI